MPRHIAIALVVLLALVAPHATAAAQGFDPSSSTFVLRGMAARKNPGTPGGAAWGEVTFGATGLVTGGNIARTGTSMSSFIAATSYLDVDGSAVDGVFNTGVNSTSLRVSGMAATDDLLVLSTETPLNPDFPGMLVGVRRTGTFDPSDLGGATWRFKALGVEVPARGGEGGWAFGTLTLDAAGSVTTGTINYTNDASADVVNSGALSITAAGAVTGAFGATMLGACLGGANVDGVMTPDKTLIAAILTLTCDGTVASGMVLFQRDPGVTSYDVADLAGTYDFVGIDQVSNQDNVGTWARGTITFDGSGEVSSGWFVDADGGTTTPSGFLEIDPQGFVCSGASPCGDVLSLGTAVELHGTMTADKTIIVGVWSRFDGVRPHTALFAWVKRPPPPTIAFSAATYTRREANRSVTITVERSGDTTSQVTVDYATDTATTGVPATAGADYTATSDTLTFAPGETSRTFAVAIADDSEVEPTELVKLVLSNPTNGAVLGSPSAAHVRITNDDSVVQFSAAAMSVAESAGTTSVAVTRTGYRNSTASVTYTITAGSAAAGADFVEVTGTLPLPAGDAAASIPLTIIQDTLAEGVETLHITLTNPAGDITLGSIPSAVVTIVDDDDAGILAFSTSTYTATEGGAAAVITVVRSDGAASGVTVDYATSDGTADTGTDYRSRSGTLSFGAGQMSRTFRVPILDDTVADGTKTVNLTLSNVGGGARLASPSTARLRILDNDSVVQFSAGVYSRPEGAGATRITVTRTGYRGSAATVNYTIGTSTATADLDYTAAASGSLSFAAGVASVPLPLTILQDTLAEGPETIQFVLGATTGGMQVGPNGSAVVTIADDDAAGTLAFSSPIYTRTEGGPAAVIAVMRSGGAASGVTVQYATSNGSARAGSDYTASAGTLSFGAGRMSRTFTVPILDDTAVEGMQTVNLALSNPSGGASLTEPFTAVLRIADNDSTVQFDAAAYTRPESAGATSLIVRRTGSLSSPARVRYTVAGGTATPGLDYTGAATGTLSFGPGVRSRRVPITIVQDTLAEGPETISVALSEPMGATRLGSASSAVLTIVDDDVAGRIAFSSSSFTATEGGAAALITVVRTDGHAGGVTVQYATSNGTATAGVDYVATSGTLTFAAGDSTATFTVPVLDDSTGEPTQTVHLQLSNPGGGAVIASPAAAVLQILDNEPVIGFTGRWVGNGLEVERTGPADVTSRVDYFAVDGTATAGVDYVPLSGTLTFGPGVRVRVISITILGDTLVEGDETFTVRLRNAVNARLGARERQVVIKDND